jgi:hypothetical protein
MMRIALFIDGIHFYRSFGQSQHEIDYDALSKWVVKQIVPNSAVFVGGYYYTYDLEQSNLQRFLDGLSNRKGFFVHKIPTIPTEGTMHSNAKHWDHSTLIAALSSDCIRLASQNHFDMAVFFSQHPYNLPIIKNLRALGKNVSIATMQSNCTPALLKQEAYSILSLQEGLDDFAVLKEEQSREGACVMTNLLWEVEQAVLFFQRKNRPVTRWYFENQWLSSRVCPSPGQERTTSNIVFFMILNIGKGNDIRRDTTPIFDCIKERTLVKT